MEAILKYFPDLTEIQKSQFSLLRSIYGEWNTKINLISRKDIENFYLHHVLHSLAIARIISFVPGSAILDVGTGGGFPGIPLAIMFPTSRFTLLDSIGKKIKVVSDISEKLTLANVTPSNMRVEEHLLKYDFIISRAVTAFPEFVKITTKNIKPGGINKIRNGIIYLKGGDLSPELAGFNKRVTIFDISNHFTESFFETKRIVYLPF